ncbi:hypothetical protein NITGR_730013 [Nitrospina gracilis 3/211]|uniref:Uncharacterized protein n=1 Tax=Nitrospina gracilis (strain 3/211) TaxID=1266370 RepID=M1Z231_NITG3|nr:MULTISPECIES: hypothetical protein [Nitrospina]MCF8724400.1 hypothetical protein [Nitrospina sp. Nb-3]CCQ91555.1 hypothetical protein NITGR_730013 [Nitrospina gracilis 3/211]
MAEIKDTGKVWIKGRVSTAFAIKVDDTVFVPGQEEGQDIEYWLEDGALCVDLHDAKNETRIARRFPLNLKPETMASLFNGFTRTKHCDTKVVMPTDDGVLETTVQGDAYREANAGSLDAHAFWQSAAPK